MQCIIYYYMHCILWILLFVFQLSLKLVTEGWTNGWTDRPMDQLTDLSINQQTGGPTLSGIELLS